METNKPVFAVVGQPNKGKSSVVATLARLSDVEISARSGTTKKSDVFDVISNNEVLYRLYDTPGFQRARQVISWMQSQKPDASERANTVKTFIEYAKQSDLFLDERELLGPILSDHQATGIIYVVDGSIPFHASIESELEVLQWTGRPRMALINPIESNEYVEQWKKALGQYFSIVRVFNPVDASFNEQMQLLDGFMQLEGGWRQSLNYAKTQLTKEKQNLLEMSAHHITLMLESILRLQLKAPLLHESMMDTEKTLLLLSFKKQVIKLESDCFAKLALLFKHHIHIKGDQIIIDPQKLFDKEQWFLWGLNPKQIVKYSALTGFTVGAAIDLSVGGASFLLGALGGGLLGGVGSLATMKFSDKWLKDIHLNGENLVAGPINNQAFMFALFGRSISYIKSINQRNHADQNDVIEVKSVNWSEKLNNKRMIELSRLLKTLNKRDFKVSEQIRLQSIVMQLLAD
ncbi:MAG: DUF3482 domain-containing protein [Saccharospirillaceae bacterium]|nr:GTPase/DUF3482 domain-containing protein [Pseudomonadales bacterium]NRB80113.1 DUF3482 domain-containing protein [Saccharospirillaceae bacterium]